jgi:site-specific DNA recombinase
VKPLRPSSGAASTSRRCAIYTRVSTNNGLDQEFNSLDAQREACEAYIKSQAHEGWRLIPERFDDGGFSGASLDRPGLVELLDLVDRGRVDIIVVYKVDRLTRSLADFAKLVERFDARAASFVSVTQSFNTTSSMGRLTLNMLLSFAQFEREVTGERIRDKIAASKKRGIWLGGGLPLGYRVEDRRLIVELEEATTVKLVFDLYLTCGSLLALVTELRTRGVTTRRRSLSTGQTIGGIPFTRGPLAYLLKNRIYVGEIRHRDKSYPGEHEAIIDTITFEAVQTLLAQNGRPKEPKRHFRSRSAARDRRRGAGVQSPSRVRAVIHADKIQIVRRDQRDPDETRILTVPWTPVSSSRRKEILEPEISNGVSKSLGPVERVRLLRAIVLARGWMDELIQGSMPDAAWIASCEGKSERSIRITLSLAFRPYASGVVEADRAKSSGVGLAWTFMRSILSFMRLSAQSISLTQLGEIKTRFPGSQFLVSTTMELMLQLASSIRKSSA